MVVTPKVNGDPKTASTSVMPMRGNRIYPTTRVPQVPATGSSFSLFEGRYDQHDQTDATEANTQYGWISGTEEYLEKRENSYHQFQTRNGQELAPITAQLVRLAVCLIASFKLLCNICNIYGYSF